MSQLDNPDRVIGGKLPVYMADTYIQREGELLRQFAELSDCIRPVQVLCQAVTNDDQLEAAVRKLQQRGLRLVQDVAKLSAERVGQICELSTNELRALVTGLYAEWQNRRQQSVRTSTSTSRVVMPVYCRVCTFGNVTVWVIDGVLMSESDVRETYGTEAMFDLAGQQNVEVRRVPCEKCN